VPYGNLNLGNVAAALRMTGADPSWLEEREREEQLAAMQRRPDVPSDTNRALEMLGSGYRVPEPAQRELPPNPYEEPPRPPRVSEQPFNPNAGTRHLRNEYTAGQNEALDLKGRQGEIASQGFDAQAAAAGEMEQQRREGFSRVQQRVDENRTQQRAYEAQAHERFNRISQLVDAPPDQSRGKVLRIIGAVLSATDRGAAVGRGLQMLGQSMAGDVQGWAQQIEAQKMAQGSALAMAAHEQGDSEHELKTEQALADMGFGVYSASLERIKAEAASQEAVRVADELQNGLRQKYVEHQLDINARSAAAGAQRQRSQADDVLYNMPLEALATAIAEGKAGKHGQEIYMQRAKNSQDVREGEAKIANLTAESKAKLTEAQDKRDVLVQGAKSAYDRLLPLEGKFNRGATKETWLPDLMRSEQTLQQRADIKNIGMAVLRAESGASIPDHEIEAKYEALPVNSGDPEVRAQGLKDLLTAFEALDVRSRIPQGGEDARERADRVVQRTRDRYVKPPAAPNLASRGSGGR
jgi:hypothetical protein